MSMTNLSSSEFSQGRQQGTNARMDGCPNFKNMTKRKHNPKAIAYLSLNGKHCNLSPIKCTRLSPTKASCCWCE
eukprot:scaffold919_cov265-Chaetoceros_neogracile.AAC.23